MFIYRDQMRFYMRFIEATFFLVSIVVLVILLGLRFRYWKYSPQGPLLASSDFLLSLSKGQPETNVRYPYFSLCNANPAKGSVLFGLQRGVEGPLWYQRFLEARFVRHIDPKTNDGKEDPKRANFHRLLNNSAHDMRSMLIDCQVSSRSCSHVQFTKHVLPSGVCYTFQEELKDSETLHLELDPEWMDYLIPNSGLVGFYLLVHDTPAPMWVHHQAAVFLGAQFHTMLRLFSTRKVYESDCVQSRVWEICLQKCLSLRIQKECGCVFSPNNDGCKLETVANCRIQLDSLQDMVSPSGCNCVRPCEHTTYSYESITQAWQPVFPGFRGFWKFQSSHSRTPHKLPARNGLSASQANPQWPTPSGQTEKRHQFAASIQMWAFLREANPKVFKELIGLEETLKNLHRINSVMQRVVKIIGQVANYSRGGGSRLMKTLLRAGVRTSGSLFDENCLDQAEYVGMLSKVSQLSEAFIQRLQNSFLFNLDEENLQLNLVLIFIRHSQSDFSRLLNDLRTSDLISDVTVLDLRRNGQKCLDASYSLNGLPSNFSMKVFLPRNLPTGSDGGEEVARGNENIISSLQAMLLATDSYLNKLSTEFGHLYEQNDLLIQEMRGLLSYHSSMEQRNGRVAVTAHISPGQSGLLRLKSTTSLFNRNAELLDILTSAVMVGSLLVVLAEGAYTAMWSHRVHSHNRASAEALEHHLKDTVFQHDMSPSLSASRNHFLRQLNSCLVQQQGTQDPTSFSCRIPSNGLVPTGYMIKWNHLSIPRPRKVVRQIVRPQISPQTLSPTQHAEHQQQSIYVDGTESTSGINTPSTSTRPSSDVV